MDPPIGGYTVPPRSGHPRPRPAALGPGPGPTDDSAVGDAVNGAVAVLTVTAALLRYLADAALHTGRNLLVRLPLTGDGHGVRRALHGPVAQRLAHPASAAVVAIATTADRLVPGLTRAVLARLDIPALVREFVDLNRLVAPLDVDAVVARVDIGAVLDRVDLNAVAARLDLNALVAQVDIARVIDRVDLDAVVERVDIDAVLDRVDLNAVAARLDLNALVAQVDIARVIDRVDLDAVVERVDLDRAVDRVDVDRVISRTDVAGLARYVVQEIDLPGLLRASTGSVTSEMVRGLRGQGADADRAVERVVDRLLHRTPRRTAADGDQRREPTEGGP